MKVIGIDPSLSCTSVAVGTFGAIKSIKSFRTPSAGRGVVERFDRYRRIVHDVLEFVSQLECGQKICLIEGYSYGSKWGSETLAEFGALLRDALLQEFNDQLWEVPPTTLKKFATGKGNAKKAEVVSKVTSCLDLELKTDDEADAAALCWLGMAAMNVEAFSVKQQEAVRKVFNGEQLKWLTKNY